MAWLPGFVRLFKATSAPGVTDDINDGYEVGDIIVDETNDNSYQCQDNAVGAAVWAQIDAAGGGIGDHGGLTGLGDDDHTQYGLSDGTRAFNEIRLTPKASSSGPEGTIFYDSDDDHVYVGTE